MLLHRPFTTWPLGLRVIQVPDSVSAVPAGGVGPDERRVTVNRKCVVPVRRNRVLGSGLPFFGPDVKTHGDTSTPCVLPVRSCPSNASLNCEPELEPAVP